MLTSTYGIKYKTLFLQPRCTLSVGTVVICLLIVLFPQLATLASGETNKKLNAPEEKIILGKQMYHEGILPSGEPMMAIIKGDVPVVGTSFTCVSCHMLSGLGSVEGGVITTPTNGKSLYLPRNAQRGIGSTMGMGGSKEQPRPLPPPARPPYTDETLAALFRGGVDSSGRVLDPVMPRYRLQDGEMEILISYLKSLSSEYSPGVDSKNLRFATVITDDVPTELQEEQFLLLDKLINQLNEQARNFERRTKDPRLGRYLSKTGRIVFRNLTLSRWTLKGSPDSWKAQLDEYYRKEPVFALLGGITTGDWKPVHEFSESNRIPCIFPQTDFPVISDSSMYTFYLSKGYYQEGETAARFINRNLNSAAERPIVQIIRDTPQGHALSTGFLKTWHELGHRPPVTITLKAGESLTKDTLNRQVATEQPITLLVWDGAETISLLTSITGAKITPGTVFVSSSYLGKKIATLPDNMRDITYISHPYRLAQEEDQLENFFFGGTLKNRHDNEDLVRTVKRSYPISKILIQVLSEMKENFYRDYVLDLISMSIDHKVPLYERLSFGPGQRYASKGCYIVQLSKGDNPTFINKSDWVIH